MQVLTRVGLCTLIGSLGLAQDPTGAAGMLLAGNAAGASATQVPAAVDSIPRVQATDRTDPGGEGIRTQAQIQSDRIEAEIRRAKAKDKGPRRFAADLFDFRQVSTNPTDGGISGDYVLGVGDRLQLNVYGSATFEVPLPVDGRGSIAVPKVGTIPVAGLSLAKAQAVVESKIRQVFSRSTVDLSVTKLREVRVFVMGEVYKPGSFLVPNLSSVVNVLALSGGPTAIGSYRQIQVMRGGVTVHIVDLYPLRAYGRGNLNFGFQNGDTIFVPLLENQVRMEGAFMRVAGTVPEKDSERTAKEETDRQKAIKRNIRRIEERLGLPLPYQAEKEFKTDEDEDGEWEEGRLRFGANRQAAVLSSLKTQQNATAINGPQFLSESAQLAALGMAQATPNSGVLGVSKGTAELLLPSERSELEFSLEVLKDELKGSNQPKTRNDKRVEDKSEVEDRELNDQPRWFSQWLNTGKAPVMLFEMMPGETIKDAVGFAGGIAIQGFSGSVSVRRYGADGSQNVLEVADGAPMVATKAERGDVITALPRMEFRKNSVKVTGWAKVQGVFSRPEGQRVGDFLKSHSILMPDTYMERGELVHIMADGTKRFDAFSLAKAMAGNPADNLVLEDRDEINLYRIGDLRLPRYLKVVGALVRPGNYEFIEGMRVSDLLFRAGIPLEKANQYAGELAHSKDGQYGQVIPLNLSRLISTEGRSPVDLKDDVVNPLLQPNDQISIFTKPDYHAHRAVILTGQVVRPGSYELDRPDVGLREMIARAGGLTAEAMPKAGIFLRTMQPVDPERKRASILAGMENSDLTSSGVNDILGRLNETRRNSTTGVLQPNPLLHGLQSGAINRLVVDIQGLLEGNKAAEVELQDGDEIMIPRRTDVVYVVGETASPFAAFKVAQGMKVRDVVELAGGYTRNADTWNVRLLKADGRIVDRSISGKDVEPGDTLLVPQRIKRDLNWTDNLAALTPLAILVNTFK